MHFFVVFLEKPHTEWLKKTQTQLSAISPYIWHKSDVHDKIQKQIRGKKKEIERRFLRDDQTSMKDKIQERKQKWKKKSKQRWKKLTVISQKQ